jgi:RNA polymerase sigma-70 factor, ECF subfamily
LLLLILLQTPVEFLHPDAQMTIYTSMSTEELVRCCTLPGEIAAWKEFVRRFHRPIATVVLRTAGRWGDCSKHTADDLIQETYLKLCASNYRILREFEHRDIDAFAGYVKVIAANIVRDHFKSMYSKKRGANRVEIVSEDFVLVAAEDAAGSPDAIERAVLMREIQRHLDFCAAGPDHDRNCEIFWLYYRVGLSAAAIATLPDIGLTTKGVESLLLRLTRDLRERMASPKPEEANWPLDSAKGILPAESF